MKFYKSGLMMIGMAFGLFLSPFLQAQSDRDESPGQRQAEGVEEIIVKARRREEALSDVPDTIHAFTEADINNRGIASIGDVARAIPNFTVIDSQNTGTLNLNVRGIGQARNGEAPIAMVIDGVQTANVNQIAQPLFDIEQIEVLKGPQGALYGRNALGGAIVITTKQPANEVEGFLRAGAGNGDYYEVAGGVSGPLVNDKVFARVSGQYSDFDGVIDNKILHEKADFKELTDFRGQLIFTPTSGLKADLRASYYEIKQGSSYYAAHYSLAGGFPIDGQANNFDFGVTTDELGEGKLDSLEMSARIDYELPLATITYVFGYIDTSERFQGDLDYTLFPIARVEQRFDIESFSHELRITSPSEQRLRWLFGAYYLDTDRQVISAPALNFGFGFVPIITDEDNENSTVSGFGQLSYDITERVELTVGARYDRDKREQVSNTAFLLFPFPVTENRDASFSAFQPKASLGFEVTEETLVYATIGSGFRSGGFNTDSIFGVANYLEQYDKEEIVSYELGFKSTLLSDALSVNGSFFYNDHSNQQIFVLAQDGIFPLSRPVQTIFNIDDSRSFGAEIETVWRPLSGTGLGVSVGWIDAEIEDFNGTGQFDGNRTPLTPEWSYSLYGQHTAFLGSDLQLTMRVDYTGQSGLYWSVHNLDKQEQYGLLDMRLALEWGPATLMIYGNNLLDEEYYTEFAPSEISGLIADIGWPGTPRRFGLQLGYKY